MKKLVEKEKLEEFSKMLTDLSMTWTTGNITQKIMELQNYYDTYILSRFQECTNEIKKEVYKKIKNAASSEERQQWYDMYKTIKESENQTL